MALAFMNSSECDCLKHHSHYGCRFAQSMCICIINLKYSAGEEKSPYFLFHGETALRKILKFQGETANSSEKFQGEISEFLRENMELYRQNLKISGRNTGISWRKYWISWRNLEKFSIISPSFSQKKRQLIMEKNKKWGFFFTCTVAESCYLRISPVVIAMAF